MLIACLRYAAEYDGVVTDNHPSTLIYTAVDGGFVSRYSHSHQRSLTSKYHHPWPSVANASTLYIDHAKLGFCPRFTLTKEVYRAARIQRAQPTHRHHPPGWPRSELAELRQRPPARA